MRTMYQYCSSYQDHALRPYFSNFPSQQDHRNPPSPLPAPPHCYDLLSSQLQPYCSPSSAPHGFSPPPAVGAGGSFTGPATAAATSPSVPASFIRSSGSSVDGFLSLHSHLLDGVHHNSHVVGSGGGGMNGSPELYEHQNEYLDLHSAMQGTKCPQPPQGAGSCTQEMGGAAEVMVGGRVRRYTAEERKERIERYRSKRNQRNFQKKITYACRKTLADSRPRVRGRFVRNDEGEAEPEAEADAGDVSSCNTSPPQTGDDHRFVAWRPATDNEDVEYGCVDPVVWANFLDTISLNNPMIY